LFFHEKVKEGNKKEKIKPVEHEILKRIKGIFKI